MRDLWLPALWLMLTAYFVLIRRVWVPDLNSWIDYVAFMGTGLLAEELLFRNVLLGLGTKIFGFRRILKFSIPVWITAALFGVQHLGYHQFSINTASLSQVAYTFVMGLVFGSLRESSGRLWPVILLHLATNVFTVLRNVAY